MTVYFTNPGLIELDTIRIMGVSVKETDTPIGYFGTGLKYAIAVLLRTGHQVSLRRGDELYEFTAKEKKIRGAPFHVVCMNDEELSITLDLGKNWEVWQAYRELHANCIDEGGTISASPMPGDTVITVKGEEIMEAFYDNASIFLQNDPWIVGTDLDVHKGASKWVYYRGVRAGRLIEPTAFTYNLKRATKLTEDRTIKDFHLIEYVLSTQLPTIPSEELAASVVNPEWRGFESKLSFSLCGNPCSEFLDAVQKRSSDARINSSAIDLLRQHRKSVVQFEVFQLSPQETELVQQACSMLEILGCYVTPQDYVFIESLGPACYGGYKDDVKYITRQTLNNGVTFLAATMWEEYLHEHQGLADESRSMQQFLIDKVMEISRRLREQMSLSSDQSQHNL